MVSLLDKGVHDVSGVNAGHAAGTQERRPLHFQNVCTECVSLCCVLSPTVSVFSQGWGVGKVRGGSDENEHHR